MKKIVKYLFFTLGFFFLFFLNVDAKENIKIYFFHGRGCPHCAEEEDFLKNLKNKYDNIEIIDYEVWYNDTNKELMDKVKKELDVEGNGVPLTVISDVPTTGYSDALGRKIERLITYYSEYKSVDVVDAIKNNKKIENTKDDFEKTEEKIDEKSVFTFPFIGEVNAKNLSLSTATMAIGLVDGFNPCAMWVLIFLISILISMKDRRRMWILGFTFLFTSGFCYFLILMFWNELTALLNNVNVLYLKIIIALVAIIGAIVNFRSYFKSSDSGCTVVDAKKRKPIIEKIKKYATNKKFTTAIFGIAMLAISVNVIELACSAGLPATFTGILGMNKITGFTATGYILLYILFFMLDDIIIFIIAMKTTKIAAISTKYNKYSHLIAAIIMLVIGLLTIFKPEWLMFNFK